MIKYLLFTFIKTRLNIIYRYIENYTNSKQKDNTIYYKGR